MSARPLKSSVPDAQGVEKTILSKMLVEGSNRRTYAVDRHAGVVRDDAIMMPVVFKEERLSWCLQPHPWSATDAAHAAAHCRQWRVLRQMGGRPSTDVSQMPSNTKGRRHE